MPLRKKQKAHPKKKWVFFSSAKQDSVMKCKHHPCRDMGEGKRVTEMRIGDKKINVRGMSE